MNIWTAEKKPIVVGMLLDGHDEPLLKTALSLAKHLHSCLEIVHCFAEPIEYSLQGEVFPNANGTKDLHAKRLGEKIAVQFLEDLVRNQSSEINIHIHIERGDPAEDLSRVAKEVSAGIIVCGLRNHSSARTLKGMSTALSLAFYAPCPVLILPSSSEIDFDQGINILISDSLGGEGWLVLESGLRLARSLDTRSVSHAYVLKASRDDIDIVLREMREGPKQDPLTQDLVTHESLEKSLLHKIHEEILYRFHNSSCSQHLLSRYHPIAALGDLESELHRIIEETSSQLIIIGRHQFYHKKTLNLDRIPYRAIIEKKAGLLIIPDGELAHLHASHHQWEGNTHPLEYHWH